MFVVAVETNFFVAVPAVVFARFATAAQQSSKVVPSVAACVNALVALLAHRLFALSAVQPPRSAVALLTTHLYSSPEKNVWPTVLGSTPCSSASSAPLLPFVRRFSVQASEPFCTDLFSAVTRRRCQSSCLLPAVASTH